MLKVVGDRFCDTFIHVVVFLAVVSLFGYISDIYSLFDNIIHKLYQVGNIGYEGIFYLFRFKNHIDRNNSIFYEPGAYQIFLNTAIFMLTFIKTKISINKKHIYLAILIVTLFTTFSTTGYIIFLSLFSLFLLKSDSLTTATKTALIVSSLLILIVISEQFYSVIFNKIDKYLAIQDITDKQDLRSFDLLVDLEIIKRHIFGVGHEKYFELVSSIGLTRLGHASSNGITIALAVYGLPFSVFFFTSYYWALNKLLGSVLISLFAFGILLIFFIGESYYLFSPLCLAIIAGAFVYTPVTRADNH